MAATVEIITVGFTVLGLGAAARVISDRSQVPSVTFPILAGVTLAPDGLDVHRPGIFGDTLPAIVGLSVAIVVFEGAFHLHIERLRDAPRETLRLVAIGAFISLVGTATIVRFALGIRWGLALLIRAHLVATGPIVITPIMNVVPVRDPVSSPTEQVDVCSWWIERMAQQFLDLDRGPVADFQIALVGIGSFVTSPFLILATVFTRNGIDVSRATQRTVGYAIGLPAFRLSIFKRVWLGTASPGVRDAVDGTDGFGTGLGDVCPRFNSAVLSVVLGGRPDNSLVYQ